MGLWGLVQVPLVSNSLGDPYVSSPHCSQRIDPCYSSLSGMGCHHWKGAKVISYSDNTTVVSVLNSRYSKDKTLSQLLRCLFFVEAYYNFKTYGCHVPGSQNEIADSLSRNQLHIFFNKLPNADSTPTAISPLLLQWLLQPTQDWISPHWMQQFSTIVLKE